MNENLPAIADDHLIAVAERAEQRIAAVSKIKNVALKITNSGDWVDQNGKPYLQASGAEKIAGIFDIGWEFLTTEPVCEDDSEGHYTYTYKGRFMMGNRSIDVDGSRSSRDGFFKQFKYVDNVKVEKTVSERDNKRDVKMAALTNCLGNGITRMLGIRNMTYADLKEFAGITEDQLGKVEYKSDKKSPIQEPQAKGKGKASDASKEKVQDTLKKELAAACTPPDGKLDNVIFADVLKMITVFEKDGNEIFARGVDKMKDAWAGKALKKLREMVAKGCGDPKRCELSIWQGEENLPFCGEIKCCFYEPELPL